MRRLTIFCCAILCACSKAQRTEPIAACDRRADIQCARNFFDNTEKHLDEIYQQVADTQEEEGVKRLALSQRNWFKFRDSYAEFVSLREIDADKAWLQLVNQKIEADLARIEELKKLTLKK